MPVCFRVHSRIECYHSLHQIDASEWVGLVIWHSDVTREISIFVKTPFNFKKKNSLNKGKTSENPFNNIAKNQEFELIIHHVT